MKTLFLTLAVMLMIPASSALFAQEKSKDAADSTKYVPAADEFVPIEVEPGFNMDELYSHLKYPKAVQKKNRKGRVIIQIYISKEGKVLQTRTLVSDNPLLEEAAVYAINQTRFTPAIQQGNPIGVWWAISVSYPRK